MEIRKNSGPLKWILIGISTLFLIVMLILPLTYVVRVAQAEKLPPVSQIHSSFNLQRSSTLFFLNTL